MTVLAFRRQRWVFFKRKTRVAPAVAGLLAALTILALVGHIGSPGLASDSSPQTAMASEAAPDLMSGYVGVTSVYDGDTFRVGAERVRILGMDAPEIGKGAKCAREQQAAVEARDYLRGVLSNSHIRMQRDGTDVYGRTLAYVYADGHNIADTMIQANLALPYRIGEHGRWCELAAN